MEQKIYKLAERLRAAQSVAVLTGAGVSQESGIATFRDPDGIWAKMRPEELASMDGFLKNPDLVWSWYQHRRKIVDEVKPNPAHYALVDLEKWVSDFTLITQNVDGLHARAGSKNVLELHGNLSRSKCLRCGAKAEHEDHSPQGLSQCQKCGSQLRPDVVWFGEMLPAEVLETAFQKVQSCEVMLSIGTSAVVFPAAQLPLMAKESGAILVEINKDPTPLTPHADFVFHAPAGQVLPELVRACSYGAPAGD